MAIKTVQVGPRVAVAEAAALTGVYRPVSHPYDKGAIYDNTAHALSEGYASNAAAQAAFPLTTAWLTATGGSAITTADTFDWAATQEAILALPATGGVVGLPRGVGWLSRGLVLGDGTASAMSTKHGISILGHGQGQYMGGDKSRATLLRPVASGFSGSALVTLSGPIRNCRLADLTLDGYDLINCCLQMYHPESSSFERLTCARGNQWQIRSEIRTTYDPTNIPWGSSNNRFNSLKLHITYTHATASGWMFGESAADGSRKEDYNLNYIDDVWINGGPNSTGVGLQIGAADACTFRGLRTDGWSSGKALKIKNAGPGSPDFMNQYPDNVVLEDCWFVQAASGQDWYQVDESLGASWTPGNGGIVLYRHGQETDGFAGVPHFPTDVRFRGCTVTGVFHRWGPSGVGGGVTVADYHLTTASTDIPAPTGTPTQHVVQLLQDATGGRAVVWNSVYKLTGSYTIGILPNERTIITFTAFGSDYYPTSILRGIA